MRGMFITLEGIDGCGKSTVAKRLAAWLESAGREVWLTMEPTDTWLGDAVRRSYSENINPYTEAFLFLADRATHTDRIRDMVAAGRAVISDRYSDSTVAYQAALLYQRLGGDMDEHLDWLARVSSRVIEVPDLTLLLDIDPEISLARLNSRREMEKFETLENLRMVRRNYLAIAGSCPGRIRVIDASRPLDDVVKECQEVIAGL